MAEKNNANIGFEKQIETDQLQITEFQKLIDSLSVEKGDAHE